MQDLDFSEFDMPGAEIQEAATPAASSHDVPAPVVEADTAAGARSYTLLAGPKVNGRKLRRITMRPVTQADIDDLADGTLPNNRALLCRLTGLHPAVIKALIWPDAQFIHGMLLDALPDFMKE